MHTSRTVSIASGLIVLDLTAADLSRSNGETIDGQFAEPHNTTNTVPGVRTDHPGWVHS